MSCKDGIISNLFNGCDLIFLVTEMQDNDKIVAELSNQMRLDNPELFEGEDAHVYFKLRYARPFDQFDELKKLILRIKDSTGLRRDFRGIVALDCLEWLGFESEEYFQVTLKYLYDFRRLYKYIFTAGDAPAEQIKTMLDASSHFFRAAAVDKSLFNHRDELARYIKSRLGASGAKYDGAAAGLLAGIFADRRNPGLKSYEKIDMVAQDLAGCFKNKIITGGMLSENLGKNRLLLSLFTAPDIIREITREGEKEGEREGESEK